MALPMAIVLFVIVIGLFNCLNVMREYERAVVFRLGRVLKNEKGPGLVLIFWPLPQETQRAIAAQAEAERERRAKIISAEGEFQASEKLAQAAAVLNREPVAITLRYLQTLIEIGSEQNTTIVFPLPLDLLGGLGKLSASAVPRAGAVT